MVIDTLEQHSFIGNIYKSFLVPSQWLKCLGLIISICLGCLFLQEEIIKTRALIQTVVTARSLVSSFSCQATGHAHIQLTNSSVGPFPCMSPPELPVTLPNPNHGKERPISPYSIRSKGESPMVAEADQCLLRKDLPIQSHQTNLHGCQPVGLGGGGDFSEELDTREMVFH